jgi:hypothetical protein
MRREELDLQNIAGDLCHESVDSDRDLDLEGCGCHIALTPCPEGHPIQAEKRGRIGPSSLFYPVDLL